MNRRETGPAHWRPKGYLDEKLQVMFLIKKGEGKKTTCQKSQWWDIIPKKPIMCIQVDS